MEKSPIRGLKTVRSPANYYHTSKYTSRPLDKLSLEKPGFSHSQCVNIPLLQMSMSSCKVRHFITYTNHGAPTGLLSSMIMFLLKYHTFSLYYIILSFMPALHTRWVNNHINLYITILWYINVQL